jgi:hypothetical protein
MVMDKLDSDKTMERDIIEVLPIQWVVKFTHATQGMAIHGD